MILTATTTKAFSLKARQEQVCTRPSSSAFPLNSGCFCACVAYFHAVEFSACGAARPSFARPGGGIVAFARRRPWRQVGGPGAQRRPPCRLMRQVGLGWRRGSGPPIRPQGAPRHDGTAIYRCRRTLAAGAAGDCQACRDWQITAVRRNIGHVWNCLPVIGNASAEMATVTARPAQRAAGA